MRRVNRNERARVALTLNGRKLSGDAEPRLLLSDFLRQVPDTAFMAPARC